MVVIVGVWFEYLLVDVVVVGVVVWMMVVELFGDVVYLYVELVVVLDGLIVWILLFDMYCIGEVLCVYV